MSAVRIGRVRLKGGADVRVIHNDTPRRVMGNLRAHVQDIEAARVGRTAVGFALIVWGHQGAVSQVCENWEGSPVSRAMLPDFVRTCLADDITRRNMYEDLSRPDDDKGGA